MKILLTTLLTTAFFCSYGQTTISEMTCKFLYSDTNCGSHDIDLTIPHLTSIPPNTLFKSVNDSINSLVKLCLNSIIPLNLADIAIDSFCGSYPPETIEMKYEVCQNTDRILSMVLNIHSEAGGMGHGAAIEPYCFNLNLTNNKIITIDSLFSKTNKEKVLTNLGMEAKSTEPDFDGYHAGSLFFKGISLNEKKLTLRYLTYSGSGIYLNNDIEANWTDLKKYINKKYLFLCGDETKK